MYLQSSRSAKRGRSRYPANNGFAGYLIPRKECCLGRNGFTLIELLVVIGIIIVLSAIAVFVLPNILRSEQGSEGASQLQGWLLIAKQRALRDASPRGLRLNLASDSNGSYVSQVQYIEQPPDLSGGTITLTQANNTITAAGIDFTGGFSDPNTYPVQPGDYLVVQEATVYQIDTDTTTWPVQATSLRLRPPRTADATATTAVYRIVRRPRPLAGEDVLELPQDVGVDWGLSRAGGAAMPAVPYFDILFSPQGTVIGTAAQYDKITLWVRDRSLDPGDGDQTLITIYCRTNALASFPVNTDASVAGGDPYYFTYGG